jgi:type I restriction enzyme, R subunit
MAEIETAMENRLIEALTQGDSQWTYRPDLKTEDDLWKNFRSILESNNRDKLDGVPLSDTEFSRVRNQVESSSFYDAGVKLMGESGKFHVQITRNSSPVLLTVFNRYHKTGGSSVYQIINQYRAFKDNDDSIDRRFDVSFLFNGLPLIHLELKNARHASYLDAFRQIQKYILEGHFKGIFSLVQMFVVSNGVQTKYIAANEVLNKEFLTSWTEDDDPDTAVADLFAFSKHVLKIPEAHEIVTDYCQLDASDRRLLILRPYQIQAIQAMRRAYMQHESGFIWHATGSGKTLTSYKASRNLLMDIPGIDKTVFLIDRKDLDDKTCLDFESYAQSDTIDVTGTENITSLEKRLLSPSREMIVTTIQKLQKLIGKYEDSPNEKKKEVLQKKQIAFVVDECHRTVTRQTQVKIIGFFPHNLWYGFTGTPIFKENQGMLGATTESMYGKPLHCYTIKNAIHDKAVLGFQVERLGPKGIPVDENGCNIDENLLHYETDEHMLAVIKTIVNESKEKLGLTVNPFGQAYEGLLTTGSIHRAQKYYDLFRKVKNSEADFRIDSDILLKYPDFPKIAITYSLTENKEESGGNGDELKKAIEDYNGMFGTSFGIDSIDSYNADLTKRFARKDEKYSARSQQLDIVIVAERLLTGFDAPCLSTIFIDRQPMSMHKLIQAFSRTNRLYDRNKSKGNVITFQAPGTYRKVIDDAITLFSKGGKGDVLAPSFPEAEQDLKQALLKLRAIAPSPDSCASFGTDRTRKKTVCLAFQQVDSALFRIRTYIEWNLKDLERDYGLSKEEYSKYAGWYHNFIDEGKTDDSDDGGGDGHPGPDEDYELQTYGKETIDYIYIVRLIQKYVDSGDVSDQDIEDSIGILSKTAPKLGEELWKLWDSVKEDPSKYKDADITVLFERMKEDARDKALREVSEEYCLDFEDVEYSAHCYMREQDEVPNFDQIRKNSRPLEYSEKTGKRIIPLSYYRIVRSALKRTFDDYVLPFRDYS